MGKITLPLASSNWAASLAGGWLSLKRDKPSPGSSGAGPLVCGYKDSVLRSACVPQEARELRATARAGHHPTPNPSFCMGQNKSVSEQALKTVSNGTPHAEEMRKVGPTEHGWLMSCSSQKWWERGRQAAAACAASDLKKSGLVRRGEGQRGFPGRDPVRSDKKGSNFKNQWNIY